MVNTPRGPSQNPSREPSRDTIQPNSTPPAGSPVQASGVPSHESTRRTPDRRSTHSSRVSSASSRNVVVDQRSVESLGLSIRDRPRHGGPTEVIDKFEVKNTWEAAKTYDFIGARGEGRKCNVLESIGHLVKSCLGGGIVAIHESYKTCGLWTALVLNVFLGFAVSYCMLILAKSAQRMYGRVQVPKMTFPDLAQASLEVGPWPKWKKCAKCFRYCVDATITIDLFGSCCVYQVVISRTIKQLVENTDSVTNEGSGSYPSIRVYIICLLIPCILICMITTLKYLAPFSIVADVFIVIVAIATIYYGVRFHTKSPLDFKIFGTVPGLFEFMGVCVFSMEGVGVTLAIENSMQEPRKFPIVLAGGMSIVVAMVMTVGFFGYWGFGENSKSPVTVNFPMEIFPIILKVFMALMIYVTFALNFWVPFELVWYYLKKRHPAEKYWLWERVYRAIFVLGITLIAVTFPNVSKFMGVLGSFCLSNMGFIFPAFIELSIDWEEPGLGFMKWRLIKFIIILLFGIALCCVGTYTNVKELITEVFFTKK
ncbi:proton-coupled amino acid transporter-like protein pathetic [Ostrinia furnacalis]|uniref:proton-coupled amino acid transporter-like protein pathetic n=1 Tax=Ostrinia furnacalis TaxID=93504 RepID=UPI00103A94DC|nr:proton-coupled amino acid transporter-like protein pathetic [Ostrinia furnacalis]